MKMLIRVRRKTDKFKKPIIALSLVKELLYRAGRMKARQKHANH